MIPRTNPFVVAPQLVQNLIDYGKTLLADGLEPSLVKLIAIRASQINSAAPGLQMYFTNARKDGENNPRLDLLCCWRDIELYSERERAALAWTEALTRLPDTRAPDEDYAVLKAHFTPEEEVRLTMLISVINSFNRMAVGHRVQPDIQPEAKAA